MELLEDDIHQNIPYDADGTESVVSLDWSEKDISLMFEVNDWNEYQIQVELQDCMESLWLDWLSTQDKLRRGRYTKADRQHFMQKILNTEDSRELITKDSTTQLVNVILRLKRIQNMAGWYQYSEVVFLSYKTAKIKNACNDTVLFSQRPFDERGDIILRYTPKEVKALQQQKVIPLNWFSILDSVLDNSRTCMTLHSDSESDEEEQDKELGIVRYKVPSLSRLSFKCAAENFYTLHKKMWKLPGYTQDDILAAIVKTNPDVVTDVTISGIIDSSRVRFMVPGCKGITDNIIRKLSTMARNLTVLDVTSCWKIQDKPMKSLFKSCRQISILSLSGCVRLTDASLQDLAKYSHKLISLNISNNFRFTEQGLSQVAKMCPLISLNISNCEKITLQTSSKFLNHLQNLSMSHVPLETDLLLQFNEHLHSLKELDIRDCFTPTLTSFEILFHMVQTHKLSCIYVTEKQYRKIEKRVPSDVVQVACPYFRIVPEEVSQELWTTKKLRNRSNRHILLNEPLDTKDRLHKAGWPLNSQ